MNFANWYRRIRNVLRPDPLQRDLQRELAFHLAEKADDLRDSGLDADEAAHAARRRFGNLTTHLERTRDMDINAGLESLVRHLKYACRALAKTPAFTVTVILTLALAIGVNSAVFSAIDAVLLRPLPFPDGDRLVKLGQSQPKLPIDLVAPVRLEDWNRLNRTLTGVTGYYLEDTSETSSEIPEKLQRAWVAPRFLEVLGVAPVLGRDFNPQEETYGGPAAVLISDRLWRRRFGADPSVIGKSLRLPRTPFAIIGVMPPSFAFPDRDVDVWAPTGFPIAPFALSRKLTWYTTIGRLKPGVTPAAARADLAAVQAGLGRQFPDPDADITPTMALLKDTTVGGVRHSLWLLFGSVSLLLVIACTNIAALLLSRANARGHEIALRYSLGASRASVVAQLLTEVLVLAIAGAAFGLLLAAGAARIFAALAKDLPRIEEIRLDGRIVLYSLACAVAATLFCGLVPALRGTRRGLAESLAHGGRSQVSARHPLQFTLAGVQVALAVTLLAGAGLLLRSFQELGRVSPGFDPRQVLSFHISSSYAEAGGEPAMQRTRRILDGLHTVPGVASVTTAGTLPGVPSQYEVELKTTEGRAETETKMLAQTRWVTPEYFATLRVPLLAGDLCRDAMTPPTVMVNRSFADRYLNGASALGHHIFQPDNQYLAPAEVRGIVGDVRETGLDREPPPTVYWCTGAMYPGTYFLVRTHGDPAALVQTIRRKVHELEPLRSVYDLTPLTDHISDAYAENRLRTVLLAFFATTAIALAGIGLYGTLSYAVSIRRREVALRMALGALRGQVVRQFLGQGLRVAAFGSIAGLTLAIALRRLLAGMLFGVSATDTVTLFAVVVLVLAVSAMACLLPAIRAARLEPVTALRDE